MALLVPVAFAPDWIGWLSEATGRYHREISHSIISVAFGSAAVALLYWLVRRGAADALWLGATYLSHWAADFITGYKPTMPGGPDVGLRLYGHPAADLIVESVLVIACALAYRRSLPADRRSSWLFWAVPGSLIAAQVAFVTLQSGTFPL